MTLNPNEFVQRHLETQPRDFKGNYTPDELHELCRRSIEILKNEPPIARLRRPFILVGDLFGHYKDLWNIFRMNSQNGVNGAYLFNYMFLGNYVDYYDTESLETICLLLGLKVLNPENYKLLRGSHECDGKGGFYKELVEKYGVEHGEKLFEHFTEVFSWLPFVGMNANISFCVNRGISPYLRNLEDIEKIPRPLLDPFSNPLANDFVTATMEPKVKSFIPNPNCPKSFLFGQQNVAKFLLDFDFVLIMTGAQSCRVPKLEINGSEVIGFYKKGNPLGCEKNEENWVYLNNGALKFKKKGINCEIAYILRVSDQENKITPWEKLEPAQKMKHDFAKVNCTSSEGGPARNWQGLFMTVVESEEAKMRSKKSNDGKDRMNVYILGFDSLSQMSFRRNLKKTVNFLENTMEAVVLNGYNIVGDGTPQAFIPILTGKTEEELPLTRKRYVNASFVDDVYPFIWSNFSDLGYVTNYAEDAFAIGTFTYRLKGFRNQPTDHFTRTFFKETEKKKRDWNCLGSETLHQNWFRYSREFMQKYADHPRFHLMHQSLLSHDDINLVSVEDDDLFGHLKSMYDAGEFENSLVILMADHGHRFAQLRSTHQGQLEERLPFFSLALPKKFRETEEGKKMSDNLKENKDRLTSPFDIYSTLLDVLHLPSLADLSKEQDASQRSLSLFRPIPESRTCSQADIAPHWCTCLNWQDAMSSPEDKAISKQLAEVVVTTMNKQLENVKDLCSTLILKELMSAKKLIPNEGLLKYRNVKDKDGFVPDLSGSTRTSFAHYQLKLSTKPGRAIYEVTLFYDQRRESVDIDLTSISHVNKFGDDPHCIIDRNYFLATYCVCHDRV